VCVRADTERKREKALAGQLAKELLFIHVILEGFAAIYENHRDFVAELAPEFGVGVNVNLAPGKAPAAGELGEAFFDHFTKVATLAGVDHYARRFWHAGKILA